MNLEEKYIIARWCYSVGEEFISNAEYNNLHRYMQEQGLLKEYVERSWSSDPCPVDLLKKYNMEDKASFVVLSDKTHSMPSITAELDLQQLYGPLNDLAFVSYKEDGWNVQLTYFNGHLAHVQTRGRKNDFVDIGKLKSIFPSTIGRQGKVRVIGELSLSHKGFAEIKKMFPEKGLVSQRAAVSTAIANEKSWSLLSFSAFDILVDDKVLTLGYIFYLLSLWGFTIPTYKTATTYAQLLDAVRVLSEGASVYERLTDGLVVRMDEGGTTRAIRIYAWEEPIYKSYVVSYNESYAAHTIPLQIRIYPIKLSNGNTQSSIPITNLARIIDNRLEPGSPIAFKFTSAAIADIDEDVTFMLQENFGDDYRAYQHRIELEESAKTEVSLT